MRNWKRTAFYIRRGLLRWAAMFMGEFLSLCVMVLILENADGRKMFYLIFGVVVSLMIGSQFYGSMWGDNHKARIKIVTTDKNFNFKTSGGTADILAALMLVIAKTLEKTRRCDATDAEVEDSILAAYRKAVSFIRKHEK